MRQNYAFLHNITLYKKVTWQIEHLLNAFFYAIITLAE